MRFAVTKLDLTYVGAWNAQERAWTGPLHFQQDYALSLKPATPADLGPAVHRRPQEDKIAAGPLPYDQRGVEFENTSAHNCLAGTLTLPKGGGRFPAVVPVSGTGRNTRDEDVSGHKVFLVLADALTRKGFAVLRYDKRGGGGSTGNFDAATTTDFASDANAAVRWLCAQSMIDSRRMGILGHSEGGIIAPMVAVSDKQVAFVVMIAGPALRGDKLFVLQSAMTSRAYGAPQDYIRAAQLSTKSSTMQSSRLRPIQLHSRALGASLRKVLQRSLSIRTRRRRLLTIAAPPGSVSSSPMTRPWHLHASVYRCWLCTDRWMYRCRG